MGTEAPLPLSFRTSINGKPIGVLVEKEIENPIHFQYQISFADGYKCVVSSVEFNNGWWIVSEPAKVDYVNAVAGDLTAISAMRSPAYTVIENIKNGQVLNVWCLDKGKETAVYYDGRYQFSIDMEKRSVFTHSVVNPIDNDVALDVLHHLTGLK